MANYKAEATAQQVAADLAVRLSLTCTVDLSGADPIITVGTATANNVGAKIKVKDQRAGDTTTNAWKALPGFSSVDQPVYTGTVFQIAVEGNDGPALFHFGFGNLLKTIGELARRGGVVELYFSNHGDNPAWTNLQDTFIPNLYYPLQGRA